MVGHVAAIGRLKDLFGTPFGTGRATMTAVSFSSGDLTNASLNLDSPRAGRFTFGAEAKGKFIEPVSASLAGAGEFSPDAAAIDIRVSRLAGALGGDRVQLTRPLSLAKHGKDLVLSALELSIGSGQISGNAAR